jgi:hypothetical protein
MRTKSISQKSKAAQKEPARQLEKKLFAKPSEVIVKAEKAVKVLKSLPGGNEAISALSNPQQALLSSSVHWES